MAVKRYNGTSWEVKAGDQNITYTATAPAAPAVGDVWVSTADIVSFDNTVQTGNRNVLINGAMNVWQRGAPTTASPTAVGGASAYTADQWNVYRAGLAAGASWSQQSTAADLPVDFRYALRVQRISGNTSTASIAFTQHIETNNVWRLRGKAVTFSFYARKGANYSATSNALSVLLVTGTGTDQTVRAGMTGQANALATSATLTNSWQRFTYTSSISASVSSLSAMLLSDPVGTAGADDWFEVTGVQLEAGSSATPFEYRPIGMELALCQRYYQNIVTPNATTDFNGLLVRESTTQAQASVYLPVSMRSLPVIVGTEFGRSVFRDTSFNVTAGANSGIVVSSSGPSNNWITLIITHGAVAGTFIYSEWDLLNTTTNLGLSSEL